MTVRSVNHLENPRRSDHAREVVPGAVALEHLLVLEQAVLLGHERHQEVHHADDRILDQLAQGDLFDREDFMADFLRLATEACKASVRAGDRLSSEEKRNLLDGFQRMRPPYTCPHGRPIITELTLHQMEKSFRRRQ